MADKPQRRLGITRRFSLEGASDSWTSDCYLVYRPASYVELAEFKSLDPENMNDQQAIAYMLKFIKSHVVGGKVMVLDDRDELELSAVEQEDLDLLPPDTINNLFAAMSGASLDPKDTRPVAPAEPQQAQIDQPTATS